MSTGVSGVPAALFRAAAAVSCICHALLTLALELILGTDQLSKDHLIVRVQGVDRAPAASTRVPCLRAFTDGALLTGGRCGVAVFYSDGHPLNSHGSLLCPPGVEPDSNLAELAAVFWVLRRHPRGQELVVFTDSTHALRCVASTMGAGPEAGKAGRRRRQKRTGEPHYRPVSQDPRWASLEFLIRWLLRLRTARTCFYKVASHKGYKGNETADALAQRGAEAGPPLPVPIVCSWLEAAWMLLSYLLSQTPVDGGTPMAGTQAKDGCSRRRHVQRPKPLSKDTTLTEAIALDCEMVGVGVSGMESRLASVCIVNSALNPVYYSYCVPPVPITDYRTQWSGITSAKLRGAPPYEQVQREVAALLKGRIVVGHDLINDFRVLGFGHPQQLVRDTARGLPRFFCRGSGRPRKLRSLAWEFLGLTIQDGEHSPCEDAQAAMLLYLRFKRLFEEHAASRVHTSCEGLGTLAPLNSGDQPCDALANPGSVKGR